MKFATLALISVLGLSVVAGCGDKEADKKLDTESPTANVSTENAPKVKKNIPKPPGSLGAPGGAAAPNTNSGPVANPGAGN